MAYLCLVRSMCVLLVVNWEAVSAIGQVVGATAVVISLIYVANEVRSNLFGRGRVAHRLLLPQLSLSTAPISTRQCHASAKRQNTGCFHISRFTSVFRMRGSVLADGFTKCSAVGDQARQSMRGRELTFCPVATRRMGLYRQSELRLRWIASSA